MNVQIYLRLIVSHTNTLLQAQLVYDVWAELNVTEDIALCLALSWLLARCLHPDMQRSLHSCPT